MTSPSSRWLVTTDWLASKLGSADLVAVDGSFYLPAQKRDAQAEFLAGHIPRQQAASNRRRTQRRASSAQKQDRPGHRLAAGRALPRRRAGAATGRAAWPYSGLAQRAVEQLYREWPAAAARRDRGGAQSWRRRPRPAGDHKLRLGRRGGGAVALRRGHLAT